MNHNNAIALITNFPLAYCFSAHSTGFRCNLFLLLTRPMSESQIFSNWTFLESLLGAHITLNAEWVGMWRRSSANEPPILRSASMPWYNSLLQLGQTHGNFANHLVSLQNATYCIVDLTETTNIEMLNAKYSHVCFKSQKTRCQWRDSGRTWTIHVDSSCSL